MQNLFIIHLKQEIITWLNNIEQQDGMPPKEVIAFNFGVFKKEDKYTMYLVGSFEYSEKNDDWACLEPPIQEYRYLVYPAILQTKNWEELIGLTQETLLALEEDGELNKTIVKNAQAITTGFDEDILLKIR